MPTRTKLEFEGNHGLKIAALLETPTANPHAFALFAHCFTCGKDIISASRIARALVAQGYGVLRFDFTGLGSSDGDFANSNFSSNVQDLISAADYLRENYQAPSLLIGHSLGGAAVLAGASEVPEAVGVVTIGAPSDPQHVVKQFACDVNKIESDGAAEVSLAGRPFMIKKQFLEDLANQHQTDKIKSLKKALLIFHSPIDATVSIREAEHIYKSAMHPKSFVSLDNADHLLTKAHDAEYVANTIAAWATRFVNQKINFQQQNNDVAKGVVRVDEKNKQFTRVVMSDSHVWLADEPTKMGGLDLGPDPYEHLLAALGTCTSMTVRMYANRKKLPLSEVSVQLEHSREHVSDCEGCEDAPKQIEVLTKKITLEGDLSEEQKQRMMEIAEKCPVNRTLKGHMEIRSELAEN